METILETDRGDFNIMIYETLSNLFRAYVIESPNTQAWGNSIKKAKENLKRQIETM